MKQTMVAVTLALMLGGCKGWLGSGSPLFDPGETEDGATADEAVVGRWSGSSTASGGSLARTTDMLVLPDGLAWTAIYDGSYAYAELVVGQLTVDGSAVTSSSRHYTHDGGGFFKEDGSATLDGSVEAGNRFNFALTTRVNSLNTSYTVRLDYDANHEREAALDTLAGQYVVGTQTLRIDSVGTIEGRDGDCTVSGQALVQDASQNLYTVTLTFGPACLHSGVMTGRAALDYSSGFKTGLTLFARPDSGTVAFLLRGTLN